MSGPQTPGQQPTPQQMAAMQQQIAVEAQKRGMTPQQFQQWQRQQIEADAKKNGMTVEQYINKLKQQAFENHQRQQQMAQQEAMQQQSSQPQIQGQQPGQAVPISGGTADPKAEAVMKWLRSQDLKPRTCILNGQRKEMFRVKRALRALRSPAYAKAASKNALLPSVDSPETAAEAFKLLPLSLLALRVEKKDPHKGHDHAPPPKQKRTKGLWHVKIVTQQDISEDLHYAWVRDGPQWKQKLYAGGAVLAILAAVMFPLWPVTLRIGVWYLSMGLLGLIGLFFLMAIFRLILFCVTVFTVPPGLWLYPNLFEDVGFFDSFRPVWGWQEDKKKKKAKKSPKGGKGVKERIDTTPTPTASKATSGKKQNGAPAQKRNLTPRVEEVEED
ncbi:MAG: hypothetical protein Q9191_000181 [Dirinaria sp. TL-2023a]